MKEFELTDYEYIELNKLLKLLALVATGGEANNRITNGEVLVNNNIETQKRKKLRSGDEVSFDGHRVRIK